MNLRVDIALPTPTPQHSQGPAPSVILLLAGLAMLGSEVGSVMSTPRPAFGSLPDPVGAGRPGAPRAIQRERGHRPSRHRITGMIRMAGVFPWAPYQTARHRLSGISSTVGVRFVLGEPIFYSWDDD